MQLLFMIKLSVIYASTFVGQCGVSSKFLKENIGNLTNSQLYELE